MDSSGNLLNGNTREAFLYFVKGLILAPTEPDLWVNLGVLYKKHGHYNYAKLAYENALFLNDESYAANANMANLHLAMGNKKKAKPFKNMARNSQITNPNYQYRMAQIEYNKKHYSRAQTHLDASRDYGITEASYIRLKEKIKSRKLEIYEARLQLPYKFHEYSDY